MWREWAIMVFTTLASFTSNSIIAPSCSIAPDAGDQVIRTESRYERRGRRADNAAVMRTQRAARHHHLKARILIQNMRHPQTVGDDAQMIMVEQRPGDVLHGRADRDENS
ncbi:hypothetical protein L1887_45288 [Cichorium endivia]|nr:hypothetical protein L1887_45288 [Cichorium endivia]